MSLAAALVLCAASPACMPAVALLTCCRPRPCTPGKPALYPACHSRRLEVQCIERSTVLVRLLFCHAPIPTADYRAKEFPWGPEPLFGMPK